MANEMIMAAARRGDLGNTPEQIMARLTQFYIEEGMPPEAAVLAARQVISSGLFESGERTNIQDRALQMMREREQQEMYRRNPRMLSEEAASPESLPGYDPTAGGASGRAQIPAFSQPMTAFEAREARVTRPMPSGDLPNWRPPAQAPLPQMSRLPSADSWRFLNGYSGQRGYEDRAAAYDAERRAVALARENAAGPAQTYLPPQQGAPIRDSGETPPAPAPSLVDRAISAVTPSRPQAAPAANPSFINNDMSAAFLDGPAAGLPMLALVPEGMTTPTAPERAPQPVRRAVQVARSTMPSDPPMPPARPPMELASASTSPGGMSSRAMFERAYETESPADFFRAEQAMREGRAPGGEVSAPKARGGGKDAVHKALEIIHHLIMRGR